MVARCSADPSLLVLFVFFSILLFHLPPSFSFCCILLEGDSSAADGQNSRSQSGGESCVLHREHHWGPGLFSWSLRRSPWEHKLRLLSAVCCRGSLRVCTGHRQGRRALTCRGFLKHTWLMCEGIVCADSHMPPSAVTMLDWSWQQKSEDLTSRRASESCRIHRNSSLTCRLHSSFIPTFCFHGFKTLKFGCFFSRLF